MTYDYVAAPSPPPVNPWFATIARLAITVAGPITPPPGTPVEAQLGFTDLAGKLIVPLTPVTVFTGEVAWIDVNVSQLIQAVHYVPLRPQIAFLAGAARTR